MTKLGFYLKPLIELAFAASLWGLAFIGVIWCLPHIDAPAIIFYRFLISTLAGFLILWFLRKSWKIDFQIIRSEFLLSGWSGFWLFATLAFQTFGMMTTTASKSAFITVLYVVMVPIITALQGTEKFLLRHLICVLLALIGLALFQELKWDSWSIGDSLTLVAAFAASMHILAIGKVAPRSQNKFLLNIGQGAITCVLALFIFPLGTRANLFLMDGKAWAGLLILSLGAGLLAFYLQVKAQEKIPPNLASLLFLLESPFSAFFAYLLLQERFSNLQWLGGVIILTSCASAIWVEPLKAAPPPAAPQIK